MMPLPTVNLLVITQPLLFFVGVWFVVAFVALFELLVSKAFKLEFRSFKIFNRRYSKIDGRIVVYKERFSFFTVCETGPLAGEHISRVKDFVFTAIVTFLPAICGIATTILLVLYTIQRNRSLLQNPFSGFVFGVGITSAMIFVISIYTLSGKKRLHDYTNEKLREIRNANSLDEIEMPALYDLNDYRKDDHSMLCYQNIFYLVSEMRRDMKKMEYVVKWYEEYIESREKQKDSLETLAHKEMFRNLIEYYSTWCIDYERASKYYKLMPEQELKDDKDANGRRLLAYYYKTILRDYGNAKNYCIEGLTALEDTNTRLCKLELENERALLTELLHGINNQ